MNWNAIRLELAGTSDFPEGSAGRAYLLRLPLDEGGRIDAAALACEPGQAIVRRFWPNEPDLTGRVVKTDRGFMFRYENGAASKAGTLSIDRDPIRLGARVTVTDSDGQRLPFRVAGLRQLA